MNRCETCKYYKTTYNFDWDTQKCCHPAIGVFPIETEIPLPAASDFIAQPDLSDVTPDREDGAIVLRTFPAQGFYPGPKFGCVLHEAK